MKDAIDGMLVDEASDLSDAANVYLHPFDLPRLLLDQCIQLRGEIVEEGAYDAIAAAKELGHQVDEVLANGQNNRRTVGDVDFDSVSQVAGWITPVPGGVGPATLSVLMHNTVAATEIQKDLYQKAMAS